MYPFSQFTNGNVCYRLMVKSAQCRMAHRDEEDASEQCAGQCGLNNLLQTRIGFPVTSEQGCDVKGQLRDGAKGGVHHRTHCKVTLGRDTARVQ